MDKREYKNIKQRMMDTFFVEKKVSCQQDLFTNYYDIIFPDSKVFKSFLGTSGKDSMIKCARQIVDRLLFDSPWNGLQHLFDNLLNMETSSLAEEKAVYIQQDHAIHSVQIYLLGIYLYFHSDVFHYALSEYFRRVGYVSELHYSVRTGSFLTFLESWKGFALLHDMAYPFEAAFDVDCCLKKGKEIYLDSFNRMEKYYKYNSYMKYYAQLVLMNIIAGLSTSVWDEKQLQEVQYFYDSQNHVLEQSRFFENTADKFYKLEYVCSNEDFIRCSYWLKPKKSILLVQDAQYEICAVILRDNENKHIYVRDKKYLDEDWSIIERIDRQKQIELGYSFTYYVQGNVKELFVPALKKLKMSSWRTELDEVCESIKLEMLPEFVIAMKKMSLKELTYFIQKKLSDICPLEKCMSGTFLPELHKELSVESIEELEKSILDVMHDFAAKELIGYEDTLTSADLQNVLKRIAGMDMECMRHNIEEEYYARKGKRNKIKPKCLEIFQKIIDEFGWNEEDKKLPIFKKNLKIDELIKFDKNLKIVEKVERLMEKEDYAQNGEGIEVLFKYKSGFCGFDHGIMAGMLGIEYDQRREMCEKKLEKRGVCGMKNPGVRSEQGIAETLYAVLVHNLYTNVYNRCCNHTPQNNLLINPFSYFGMFCDNLQVWDRNKSINHGLIKWEGSTLYGEDIDIVCEDGRVRIVCQTDDIKNSFMKLKGSLNEYLPGAEKMIALELLEG